MADDWDEDEFGTFESADASSPQHALSASTKSSVSTPAWLLATPPQSLVTDSVKSDVNEVDDLLKELTANKEDELPVENTLPMPNLILGKDENTNDKIPSGDWKPFSDISDEVSNQQPVQSLDVENPLHAFPEKSPVSPELVPGTSEVKPSIENTIEDPKKDKEILDLKGKLDTALAMKEHTEKSLEELRKEMADMLAESIKLREQKDQEYQTHLTELNEIREKEIAKLKEESQKTMVELTEKFATLSGETSAKLKSEHEKDVEEVVEKCLKIMETQGSVISEKLSEDASNFDSNVTSLISNCRTELKEFVDSQSSSMSAKYEKMNQDMAQHMKDEIAKEIEIQREVDLKCKKDAMEELSRHLKSNLEETLKLEREKTAATIKLAVQEAQDNVRRSLEKENERNKLLHSQHLMSLQVLLNSSQEQLRHLTDTLRKET